MFKKIILKELTKRKKFKGFYQNSSSERKPTVMNSFCGHGNKHDDTV